MAEADTADAFSIRNKWGDVIQGSGEDKDDEEFAKVFLKPAAMLTPAEFAENNRLIA